MIPQGRITPITLQKRAEELAKLFNEFSVMVGRVQPVEALIGGYSQTMIGQEYPSNSFRSRQEPTQPLHQVAQRASDFDLASSAIETINQHLRVIDKRIAELTGVSEGEATMSPIDQVNQLQAVSRGMANAVRRIRALEEENRLLREAQLATVQDVLGLQESVRRLEYRGDGESQQVDG